MGKLYFYILGLITGLANGLFGSGGGIIAVPMLKKSGITTKESHATSLALTLPLSIVSCFFYIRNSDKILPDSLRLIPFGLAGAIIGGIIMKKIAPKYLKGVLNNTYNFRIKVIYKMNFWILAAAFLTGIFASLGLGGGMILILYMTIFAGYTQLDAQGINLIFFIPIALLSLIIHTKSKLVKWKKIIPSVICGIITAVIGCIIAKNIGNEYLTKIFAVFVLLTGIKELFTKVRD